MEQIEMMVQEWLKNPYVVFGVPVIACTALVLLVWLLTRSSRPAAQPARRQETFKDTPFFPDANPVQDRRFIVASPQALRNSDARDPLDGSRLMNPVTLEMKLHGKTVRVKTNAYNARQYRKQGPHGFPYLQNLQQFPHSSMTNKCYFIDNGNGFELIETLLWHNLLFNSGDADIAAVQEQWQQSEPSMVDGSASSEESGSAHTFSDTWSNHSPAIETDADRHSGGGYSHDSSPSYDSGGSYGDSGGGYDSGGGGDCGGGGCD